MSMICIDQDTESMVECPQECEPWENWSAIYVNDVQHNSESIINIQIPEELERDYEYQTWQMNINISWYNVDTSYMNEILAQTELYPTNEDFWNLMVGLSEFLPYVFITLLMIFFIKLVNKVWK